MARTRSIKPSFFDNEDLGDLTPLTRLLFIGLWCIADREGRLEDKPKRIKKIILGYDDVSISEVDNMLASLHKSGFIFRYHVDDDEDYIQIINFTKHQNPHIKEQNSAIPPPRDMYCASMVQASCKHDESTEQAGPITGNLLPSTGTLNPITSNPNPVQAPGVVNENETQSRESLAVEKAAGAGESKPASPSKTLIEQSFDIFWQAYPKKRKKGDAEKIWKMIRPDDGLLKHMLDAIKIAIKSVDWTKDNGQYIPYPATWLKSKGWEDEYFSGKDSKTGKNPDGFSHYKRDYKERDIYEV